MIKHSFEFLLAITNIGVSHIPEEFRCSESFSLSQAVHNYIIYNHFNCLLDISLFYNTLEMVKYKVSTLRTMA